MKKLPAEVHRVVLDVTSEQSCKEAIEHVVKVSGSIDILVNNAGMGQTGALLDFPLELIRKHMETNFIAAVNLIQLVAPHMAAKGSGLVINIGSGLGYMNFPFTAAYSATKHALHSVSDILRVELAPLGIDVMLVVPGFIRTPMVTNMDNYPRSKVSQYGYNAFRRGYWWLTTFCPMFAASPQGCARRVVGAATSFWGPPRHLTLGTGVWWAMFEGWLPLWVRDWLHGILFEMKPAWRAAGLMRAAQIKQKYKVDG